MFFFFYDEENDTTVQAPVENTENFDEKELEFFYNDKIRKVWHKQEEEWYFSIVDVCQVLTDSTDATTYWRKLKQRLKKEGNQTVTNCHRLKLKAAPVLPTPKRQVYIRRCVPKKQKYCTIFGHPKSTEQTFRRVLFLYPKII